MCWNDRNGPAPKKIEAILGVFFKAHNFGKSQWFGTKDIVTHHSRFTH